MIKFTEKTDTIQIENIVKGTWNSDEEFFEKYMVNENKEASINDTLDKIIGAMYQGKELGTQFFSMEQGMSTIGYICIMGNYDQVLSFCIHPKYRTKDILSVFVEKIESLFSNKVSIPVYSKNTRAINFFKRYGYIVETEFDNFKNKDVSNLVRKTK